ncbi:MAG TPA: DUF1203 domain-containing protein [Acidimicrobiales bacterium]|jgi:hypothetical protein
MTTSATTPPAIDRIEVTGADPSALDAMRSSGLDHGGNPVEPFVDSEGGWPLRCCLADSHPGEELAIVGWSPFPWRGPFAEVGPIVVHARVCDGPAGGVPAQFLTRPQVVRPYGFDRRIAYDHVRVVEPDGSLPAVLAEVLAAEGVDFAHVRNVGTGCYSFTARLRGEAGQA